MENIQEKAEDKIIDWIALDSGGRLICYRPEGSDVLVAERKGGYGGKKIILKIEPFLAPSVDDLLVKDILEASILPEKGKYLFFCIFDEIKQKIDSNIWLVPSLVFMKIAEKAVSPEGRSVLRFNSKNFDKFVTDEHRFGVFLVDNLIAANKPKAHAAFKPKVF